MTAIVALIGAAISFTPFNQRFTSGNSTIFVPSGARHLTIKVVGGGGIGGIANPNPGGGGGSGGLNTGSFAIVPSDWEVSLTYGVGAGGTISSGGGSSVSGTLAAGSVAIFANGGNAGLAGSNGGGGGSGGTPAGNPGLAGVSGGAGGAPPLGDGQGTGGQGGNPGFGSGVNGEVIFEWT